MRSFAVVILIFLACTSTSHSAKDCSFDECTAEAPVRVKQTISKKDDSSILMITYECKNSEGEVVYKCETEEKNPYGDNVQVQSFSYRGSFSKTYSSGSNDDKGIDINVGKDVELLD